MHLRQRSLSVLILATSLACSSAASQQDPGTAAPVVFSPSTIAPDIEVLHSSLQDLLWDYGGVLPDDALTRALRNEWRSFQPTPPQLWIMDDPREAAFVAPGQVFISHGLLLSLNEGSLDPRQPAIDPGRAALGLCAILQAYENGTRQDPARSPWAAIATIDSSLDSRLQDGSASLLDAARLRRARQIFRQAPWHSDERALDARLTQTRELLRSARVSELALHEILTFSTSRLDQPLSNLWGAPAWLRKLGPPPTALAAGDALRGRALNAAYRDTRNRSLARRAALKALSALDRQDDNLALAAARQALKLDPKSASHFTLFAEASRRALEPTKNVEALFRRAAELNQSLRPRLAIVRLDIERGWLDLASQALSDLEPLGRSTAALLEQRAELASRRGDSKASHRRKLAKQLQIPDRAANTNAKEQHQ